MLSEWHYCQRNYRGFTIYFILACAENLEIPYFLTQWNTLWVSSGSPGSDLRSRSLYKTRISTNTYLMSEYAELFVEILNQYNWTSITVIIDSSSPPFHFTLASTFLNIVKYEKHIVSIVRNIETKAGSFTGFQPILDNVRATSRVVLYFGGEPGLQDFLPYILILSSYMTVFAIAEVINDTIALGKRPDWSGVALAKRLSNRTFNDDFGHSMYLDSEGQRRSDFVVSFFNANGSREVSTVQPPFCNGNFVGKHLLLLLYVHSRCCTNSAKQEF
ncbi:uncharacterized protein LOC129585430 [Paramacrobiotus metropolitanus]|uniref:uncharacterized protein LOC129585430 n=1 Tax=Paramacrobiotus metropolitanus TaxID=2943436 RepID=UPI002445EB2F|nr:uncharacterized protein LOC129585430 [Paramacrobiotus metropolitanus]